MAREETEDAIIAYKSILAQIIDNRPSEPVSGWPRN